MTAEQSPQVNGSLTSSAHFGQYNSSGADFGGFGGGVAIGREL
jgi:hypothetical protein